MLVNDPNSTSDNSRSTVIWEASPARRQASQIELFAAEAGARFGRQFVDYQQLWQWSIDNAPDFWDFCWDFTGISGSKGYETTAASCLPGPQSDSGKTGYGGKVIADPDNFSKARFFPAGQLNFTANVVAGIGKNQRPVIHYHAEDKLATSITGEQLTQQVHAIAAALRSLGITRGDRVAAMMPNSADTIIACLASVGLGAVWSSTATDAGIAIASERFKQIEPTVLFICDGYFYKGKKFSTIAKLEQLVAALPTLQHVIICPQLTSGTAETALDPITKRLDGKIKCHFWSKLCRSYAGSNISWPLLPFNHPLFILFSSGTTGKPKCIVHGAGGTLLQHRKEHTLHCDLRPGDGVFFFTNCGWMMWNWLLSCLAGGCRLLLYDGSPFHPSPDYLWHLVARYQIVLFGCSASYLAQLAQGDFRPRALAEKLHVKTICSTGSPLYPEQFKFVYSEIGTDIHLASISGGTDIIACFVLGVPNLPVRVGEIQAAGLGMAVAIGAGNDKILPARAARKGELLCCRPFPSMPLGFWNDPGNHKFLATYFANSAAVWHHGDFIEQTASGGYIIHGRSDTTLNAKGIRIGSSEIYAQLCHFPVIDLAVAIDQQQGLTSRIILFVKTLNHRPVDDKLRQQIKQHLRQQCSPHHVPAKIIQVKDIPMTVNGKISEQAVRAAIADENIGNTSALINPESLSEFRQLAELDS